MIQDRLKALRSEMAKRGISLYVVPTADFHESEYVGEHFKARIKRGLEKYKGPFIRNHA